MISNKRSKKIKEKIHRVYDRKFYFIESVLNSCATLDQVDCAARWGASVMEQYHKHEKYRVNKFYTIFYRPELLDIINKYFSLKQDIINLIFERKINEIEGTKDTISE